MAEHVKIYSPPDSSTIFILLFPPKDVPFGGLVHTAPHFGGKIPQKPQFWGRE